jgi:hypothetical protein
VKINRKLLEWVLVVGGPAFLVLIYIPTRIHAVAERPHEPWVVLALAMLPGIYGVTLSSRGFWPRLFTILGYVVAVVAIFFMFGFVYGCMALKVCL